MLRNDRLRRFELVIQELNHSLPNDLVLIDLAKVIVRQNRQLSCNAKVGEWAAECVVLMRMLEIKFAFGRDTPLPSIRDGGYGSRTGS